MARPALADHAFGAAAGAAAAVAQLGAGFLVAAVLARQTLVQGASAPRWAVPALATMLGVVGNLGPAGVYNEAPDGALGLGIKATPMPWCFAAVAPLVVTAALLGRRLSRRSSVVLTLAGGYAVTLSVGIGLGSMWAQSIDAGVLLPVSPDRVAGRGAALALVVAGIAAARDRIGRFAPAVRPVAIGALAVALLSVVVWLAGIALAVASLPAAAGEPITTTGSILGGNLTAAALFDSLGGPVELSVRSGLSGRIDTIELASVVGWSGATASIIATVLVLLAATAALAVALRGQTCGPPILIVLGVALGMAAGGALLARQLSGQLDLVILPVADEGRSFSQVMLAMGPWGVASQVGSRALLGGLPLAWWYQRTRRTEGAA